MSLISLLPRPASSLACVLLYAAALAFASPAAAEGLSPEARAGLEAMREGDMRKLVFAEEPAAVPDIAFTDRAGAETTLAASNGRWRIVNFWATWCAPCRHEMPSLDALQRARGGARFEVILVATGRNNPEAIDAFFAETGITSLATYLDPRSKLAWGMDVPGLPVTLILNPEGREVARLLGGADWNSPSANAILDALLAEGPKT